ncbi:MFS transporter [Nocardioides bruguierae]|uniref:MFS transporter n=1 Tax=Nocardioides bruguierae TaxID=2945102 RepID=A0A9X2IFT9_9ACTN|nr:MFS transporter [Nocardioides bruguierae]MCM0620874.1 MFS transporter [Nocardioides bruguierae]
MGVAQRHQQSHPRQPGGNPAADPGGARRATIWLFAGVAGVTASTNYYNQPLVDSIARGFGVSDSAAATSVTVAQVCYSLGLLLIVPSGDLLRRRRLATVLLALVALGLVAQGFAPTYPTFLAGLVLTAFGAVTSQVLVAFSASLAPPGQRAGTVGTVMSGMLLGILLGRSVAGILSEVGGWQTVYRVAAVLAVLALLGVRALAPEGGHDGPTPRYLAVLRSMPPLLVRFPRLVSRTLMGGLTFAGASAVFATMSLHLSRDPFDLSDGVIGLIGLVGVAGAVAATPIGRGVDRGWDRWLGLATISSLGLAWVLFSTWGATSIVVFVVAMVLLDLGLQGTHVANQGVIQSLDDAARARITSIYMTGYFLGATLGSAIGVAAWDAGGWTGICVAGFVLLVLAYAAWGLDTVLAQRERRAASAA